MIYEHLHRKDLTDQTWLLSFEIPAYKIDIGWYLGMWGWGGLQPLIDKSDLLCLNWLNKQYDLYQTSSVFLLLYLSVSFCTLDKLGCFPSWHYFVYVVTTLSWRLLSVSHLIPLWKDPWKLGPDFPLTLSHVPLVITDFVFFFYPFSRLNQSWVRLRAETMCFPRQSLKHGLLLRTPDIAFKEKPQEYL